MPDPSFTCNACGQAFSLPQKTLDRFPGWQPKICMPCKDKTKGGSGGAKKGKKRGKPKSKRGGAELNLTLQQVLEKFDQGPTEGVFTDGSCIGNPGPGGWGAVWVEDNKVVKQRHGHEADTTNNRMELMALIEAYRFLPEDAQLTIWSDSNLCVQTINQWAAGWQRRGWKRKTGPVLNLDLVKIAYQLSLAHPRVSLRWIKAHNGSRWNEYADSLATAFQRAEL